MTQTDTNRRVERLRKIPLFSNTEIYPDTFVSTCMEDALMAFFENTGRTQDLGETIDALIVDLCKDRINRTGLEGAQSTSEGGVSQTWAIEPLLLSRIFRYKLMPGMREAGASAPGGGGSGGTGGGNASSYEYVQDSLSSQWTINHNLGGHVAGKVYGNDGEEMHPSWQYINDNTVHLIFSEPTEGVAKVIV
jgi:hypothetical protein